MWHAGREALLAVAVEGVALADVAQTVLVCERALIVDVPVIGDGGAEAEEARVVAVPVSEPIFAAVVVSSWFRMDLLGKDV